MLKNGKAKVVIIGQGQNVDRFVNENRESDYIEIIGLVPDGGFNRINDGLDIDYIGLLDNCDIGFVLGYSNIIPEEVCDNYFLVNLHAGILPKWRGFSANAWAIMNGENEIGYSLHRVTTEVDGGCVYFVKRIAIDNDGTLCAPHRNMIDSIINECPRILHEIVHGNLKGESQKHNKVAYCTRFRPEMGVFKNFGKTADYYVNLYRCMAEPLGSGVYFIYNNERYHIGCVEHGKKYGVMDYICEEGKIVNIENNAIWVKTQDNVIVLSEVTKDGMQINIKQYFRNGNMLGS